MPADTPDLDTDGDTSEPIPFDLDGKPRIVDGDGDSIATVDMGAYEFYGIFSVLSLLDHGGTELALDLTDNNIDPRADGVLSLELEVVAPVSSVSASVTCVNSVFGGTVSSSALGTTVTVDFSVSLPDEDCCTVTLTGDLHDSFDVRRLRGDMNRDGIVSTADASIIKPKFGQVPTVVGAELDYNVDGIISTADFSQVKPLFGNSATACP